MNVRPGYIEKLPNLQGTLKLHLTFFSMAINSVVEKYTLFASENLNYQSTFLLFNNICSTLTCVYTYDRL